MKIGFDAKRVFTNFTGLGNYSRFVIHILSKYYSDNEYILYSPVVKIKNGYDRNQQFDRLIERSNIAIRTIDSRPPFNHLKGGGEERGENRPTPNPTGRERGWQSPTIWGGFRGSFCWRTFALAAIAEKDQCNLFHGLTNELPVGIGKTNVKSVVTIHDLVFLRFPELYPVIDRIIYNYKCKYACSVADKIIAVSEQTKKDIIEFYKIDPRKIEVVYQCCEQIFKQEYSEGQLLKVKKKYNLPQNYILNVGRIEKRKNTLVILKALKNIKDKVDISLVIVGKSTTYKKELLRYISKNGLLNRIFFIHNVNFSDLPHIYQMAKLFVYPSLFEGFGIPIIEALYSGVPVITSKGSCFSEAAGPSSLYVSSDNATELSDAITRVLLNAKWKMENGRWKTEDGSVANKMVKEGKAYTCKFDENILAGKLMKIYESISYRTKKPPSTRGLYFKSLY